VVFVGKVISEKDVFAKLVDREGFFGSTFGIGATLTNSKPASLSLGTTVTMFPILKLPSCSK
jgi:hypothetical protein